MKVVTIIAFENDAIDWAKKLNQSTEYSVNIFFPHFGVMEATDCQEMIRRSDGIFVAPGWEEYGGLNKMREFAASLELPIFYEKNLDFLKVWANEPSKDNS